LLQCAADILKGNISSATRIISDKMLDFAQNEQFEAAARCRDTIKALERLNQKQSVVASPDINADVFALYSDEFISCVSVMYIREGLVNDKSDFLFNTDAITDTESLSSFLADHYIHRDYIPKSILVSFDLEEDDIATLEEFLSVQSGHRVYIKRPERGANKDLTSVVYKNAEEKARQAKLESQKDEEVLIRLAQLLMLETLPERIEAYDISNIGTENITAGMVVYDNAKPCKSDYRLFKIRSLNNTTDDYASMQEAIRRRMRHLKDDSAGSFSKIPDLMLIDGGKGHISAVKQVLHEENIDIPVFGMVKDDFHKTRALCTDTEEINIARERSVFMLIYKIQEEVHRFTVGKVMSAKRSTLKHSSLEKIDGIGPNKAKILLSAFKSLSAIKNATEAEISAVKGISKADAQRVWEYFQGKDKK
jgi:excinuclease ABC subunit C